MLPISLELLSAVRIAGVQLAFHAVALGNRDADRNGMAAPVGGGLVYPDSAKIWGYSLYKTVEA